MKTNRPRRTNRQWRRLFELHRQSGLSVAAFCGQRGLAVSTFFAKRASLLGGQDAREGEPAARLGGVLAPPRFVEVNVDGDGSDEIASPSPAPSPSFSSTTAAPATCASADLDVDAIELLLGRDVVVRVCAGFNASLLRQVVASLRGLR